jgi:hypothetical protein
VSTSSLEQPRSYPLFAEGWGERSIFGWDPLEQSWWAQLWRDTSANDEPDIWLGVTTRIDSVSQLIRLIAERSGLAEQRVDAVIAKTMRPGAEGGLRR